MTQFLEISGGEVTFIQGIVMLIRFYQNFQQNHHHGT